MRKNMMISLLLVLALVAISCGDDAQPDPEPTGDPVGVEWRLRNLGLDGLAVDLAGATPTIRFEPTGDAGGTNGCNSYGGQYTLSGDGVSFGALFQTEIGCEPAVAAVESAFMSALARVDRWSVADGVLVLSASDGSAALEFVEAAPVIDASLLGSWLLDSIGEAQAVSSIVGGTEPTLEITETEISGSTGCNTFFGSLTWDGDGTFRVSEMGWTEIGCEQGIMRQEQAVLETLLDATGYQIEGDKLLIETAGGNRFLRYTSAG
jgi:heat shock protein HslJ